MAPRATGPRVGEYMYILYLVKYMNMYMYHRWPILPRASPRSCTLKRATAADKKRDAGVRPLPV